MSLATHSDANISMMDRALEYARRGWPVFPCSQLNKQPLIGCDTDEDGKDIPNTGGLYKATLDPDQVREWWTRFPNAMIGVPMGSRSGVFAIDPDAPKRPGQPDGRVKWAELLQAHGPHQPTHTHNTPNAGQHILFRWHPDKPITNREGALKKTGINVRGEGGYVIVPPSMVTDGRRYEIAESLDFFNFAEAPQWLYDLILAKPEPTISERAAAMVQRPTSSRRNSPYADAALRGEVDKVLNAGLGGRNNELNSAAFCLGQLVGAGELAEHEVTGQLLGACEAVGLIQEDGYKQCMATIQSGLRSGVKEPRRIPERDDRRSNPPFMECPRPAEGASSAQFESLKDGQPPRLLATPYSRVDPRTIPQRDWLYGHLLVRQFVSMTVSPGGIGKSSLITAETLAMASGRDLLGVKPRKRLKVWLWNLEDPQIETQRKIEAAALHFNLDPADTDGFLYVNSGRDTPLVIAEANKNGAFICRPVIENLVEEIRAHEIDVLQIDPFVSSHRVPENDNGMQDLIVKEWGRVAGLGNCAVHVIDHTRKASAGENEITVESSRGAKAKTDGARVVRVLNRMSEGEAEKANVENNRLYFRAYNDKSNLAPPAEVSDWFKLESVNLGNGSLSGPGDSVGVTVPWQWPDALAGVTGYDVNVVFDRIKSGEWRENHQSPQWVGHAVAEVLDIDTSTKGGKAKVSGMVKSWLQAGSLTIVDGKDEAGRQKKFIEVSEAAQ